VFCAVRATIAVVPKTPAAANAFRSAWMPAPPPESEPAMVRARGTMSSGYVSTIDRVRMLAALGLLGIQQAVPGPFVVSLLVTAAAAAAGIWAVATLRQ
jgi:hypothetical protein